MNSLIYFIGLTSRPTGNSRLRGDAVLRICAVSKIKISGVAPSLNSDSHSLAIKTPSPLVLTLNPSIKIDKIDSGLQITIARSRVTELEITNDMHLRINTILKLIGSVIKLPITHHHSQPVIYRIVLVVLVVVVIHTIRYFLLCT